VLTGSRCGAQGRVSRDPVLRVGIEVVLQQEGLDLPPRGARGESDELRQQFDLAHRTDQLQQDSGVSEMELAQGKQGSGVGKDQSRACRARSPAR